jgi:hypothetical protein
VKTAALALAWAVTGLVALLVIDTTQRPAVPVPPATSARPAVVVEER